MRCLRSLQNARAQFWIRFVIAFSQANASLCWDPANKKERTKGRRIKYCLPCICSVSWCATFVQTRTRQWAVQHTWWMCMWVTTVDVTSSVQTVSKCCISMACGWCVAQTLLLTRVPTPLVLALCQLALQKVGSCCLTTSTSLMSWINTLRTSAEDPWHPGRETTPPQVMSPTTTSLQRHMSNTPRSKRAADPSWLRLRWRHHRSDAPSCVTKTSRSLWRRRPVVLSVVVVCQSW